MRHSARLVSAVLALALVSAAPALPQVHRTAPARPASLTDTLRGFFADFFLVVVFFFFLFAIGYFSFYW